jgi:hypothetical protein
MRFTVLHQTKVRLTACSNPKGQDRKEPNCYIHPKEVGGEGDNIPCTLYNGSIELCFGKRKVSTNLN